MGACCSSKPSFEQASNKEMLNSMLLDEKNQIIKNTENYLPNLEKAKKVIGNSFIDYIEKIEKFLNQKSFKKEDELKQFEDIKRNLTKFFKLFYSQEEEEFTFSYVSLDKSLN